MAHLYQPSSVYVGSIRIIQIYNLFHSFTVSEVNTNNSFADCIYCIMLKQTRVICIEIVARYSLLHLLAKTRGKFAISIIVSFSGKLYM